MISTRTSPTGCEDSRQLVRFFKQPAQFVCRKQIAATNYFQPIHGFIGFFCNDTELGRKFGARPGTTGCAIVRTDRGAAANKLITNRVARLVRGKSSTSLRIRRANTFVRVSSSALVTSETTSNLKRQTSNFASKERIVSFLFADCRYRTVSRANDRVVGQRQDFLEIIL